MWKSASTLFRQLSTPVTESASSSSSSGGADVLAARAAAAAAVPENLRRAALRIIRTGGETVHLDEVEAALEAHPLVSAAAIVPMPCGTYGETGHAFLVMGEGGLGKEGRSLRLQQQGAIATTLREHCHSALLSEIKLPAAYYSMPALPELPDGSVDEAVLKQHVTDHALDAAMRAMMAESWGHVDPSTY